MMNQIKRFALGFCCFMLAVAVEASSPSLDDPASIEAFIDGVVIPCTQVT